MTKNEQQIEFLAGDKIKLSRPRKKKAPKRIGSTQTPDFMPVTFRGIPGRIYYDRIYQVTGGDKTSVVDNSSETIPFIDKEFINHPVFNRFFTAVEKPKSEKEK